MSENNLGNPPQKKKSGCRWIIVILGSLIVMALLIKLACFVIFPDALRNKAKRLQTKTVIKDLRIAIISFQVEWNRYPIPTSDLSGEDISMRSRGPIIPLLIGDETAPSNSPRGQKFIDLPKAKNRLFGLWQDGSEWVLSDLWGEPYYIVLDTNNDHRIANPELGADLSDPEYAKQYRAFPPPSPLPSDILIYSSGPDRDPKTWHDNVCSWRSY